MEIVTLSELQNPYHAINLSVFTIARP